MKRNRLERERQKNLRRDNSRQKKRRGRDVQPAMSIPTLAPAEPEHEMSPRVAEAILDLMEADRETRGL